MTYVTPHIGPARYVAVDLETTGLGEDAHLLEISVLILDAQLRERASYTTLVHHPAGALNRLDEKVREMHTASGLLADLADATGLPTVAEVERDLLALLDEHQSDDTPIHLAGGGVAQFDQPFLKRTMPNLIARLHYRPVDFSIIRQAYKDANGIELAVPDYEHPHRAEADIRSDVQVGRILYNTLRTAHRAGEYVAPAVAPSTREVAADLIAHTLATGNVPAITDATPDLVEALLDEIRQRAHQPA